MTRSVGPDQICVISNQLDLNSADSAHSVHGIVVYFHQKTLHTYIYCIEENFNTDFRTTHVVLISAVCVFRNF